MVKMGVDNGTPVFHVYLKYLQSQLNKTVLRRKKQHLLAPSVACPSRSPRFHTRFPQTLPGRSGCRPRATGSATPPSPGHLLFTTAEVPPPARCAFPVLVPWLLSSSHLCSVSPACLLAASSCGVSFYVSALSGWVLCRGRLFYFFFSPVDFIESSMRQIFSKCFCCCCYSC